MRDRSVVLSCKEPTELVIRARMWPLGEAFVTIRLAPAGEGATRVEMFEDFAAGPLRAVHTKINDVAAALPQRRVAAPASGSRHAPYAATPR